MRYVLHMLMTPNDIQEFANRWANARIAAITLHLADNQTLIEFQASSHCDRELAWREAIHSSMDRFAPLAMTAQRQNNELYLLKSLQIEKRDDVLRSVFNNSRKFGQSFVRYHNIVLETSDLRALLPKLKIPCLTGKWYRRDDALVRETTGCFEALKLGSFYCDYWREAIDGLTMGITDDIFFARHASCRHGDERCLDVWFEENGETTRASSKGALPDWAQQKLAIIADKFHSDGIRVTFEGLSEGVLYCQITSSRSPSCRDQGSLEKLLANEIRVIWPGVVLKNTTPLAVYGERV